MSHMGPFRMGGQNLPNELSSTSSNPKKRKKNVQIQSQPTSNVQDLLPPPLSGYGDTVVASNPFDDCPNTVNSIHLRNHGGMGMGPGVPVNMSNMGMGCRPLGPGMNSMMHGGNTHPGSHMLNNSMMMGNPRMNGPMGNPVSSHLMHPNNTMHVSGPLHSPMSLTGGGPMSGGMGGNPVNSPQMNGPHPGNLNMNSSNGPIGPPDNNNFLMSPMNSMYSKPMPVSAGKVYPADQPMVFNSQNPNAPPIYPCGVCHKEVHDNDQAILCESGCNFWFHRGCTGLTETAFQLLTAEVYAEWVCDKCLSTKSIPLVKFKP